MCASAQAGKWLGKVMPVDELLERARTATERQQLDLADHYFCLAAQQHASRVTKESVLDHANVLLLLAESAKRAATLAASLADHRQMSSSIFERAIYIQVHAKAPHCSREMLESVLEKSRTPSDTRCQNHAHVTFACDRHS